MLKYFIYYLIALLLFAQTAFSRITVQWESIHDFTTNQRFTAVTEDSSGNIYLTGDIDIVKWDGTEWTILGEPLIGEKKLLAVNNDGTLYACAQDLSTYNFIIQQWDGSTWEVIAEGTKGYIHYMSTDKEGNLLITGQSMTIDGVDIPYLGKWDGSSWSSWGENVAKIDTLLSPFNVGRVKADKNGDLYVSFTGKDTSISSSDIKGGIAKWNDSSWNILVERQYGMADFAFDSNNRLVFSSDARVCYYDSGTVTSFGTLAAYFVNNLYLDSADNIYITGNIDYIDGNRIQGFARWDGSEWSDLNSNLNYVTGYAFHDKKNEFYVTNSGELNRYDTTDSRDWVRVGEGEFIDGDIEDIVIDSKNCTYVGGTFNGSFGNVETAGLVKWDGENWSRLPSIWFEDFAVDNNDTLYAVDDSWDCVYKITSDSTTEIVGDNLGGDPAIIEIFDNTIYVGGELTVDGDSCAVAQWDGSKWIALKNSTPDSAISIVYRLAQYKGDLYAAARMRTGSKRCVIKWNGSKWEFLNESPDEKDVIRGFESTDNGLYLSNGDYVEKWDGTEWTTLGEPFDSYASIYTAFNNLFAYAILPSGNYYITMWDSTNKVWEPLDGEFNGIIRGLAVTADSNMIAVGDFTRAGNTKAVYAAKCKLNMVTAITESSIEIKNKSNILQFAPNPVSQSADKILIKIPSSISNSWKITIYDNTGNLIDHQSFTSHKGQTYSWDLKNRNGQKVSSGIYIAEITCTKQNGETIMFKKSIGVKEEH